MESLLAKYKDHFPDIPNLFDYQSEVIERLRHKQNTLAIVPTGGGKSLIFQLIALDRPGITIVVSPLLALMDEQVRELNTKRKISALALNSNLSLEDQRKTLRNLPSTCKLIYLSPERLQNPFFRAALIASGVEVSMVVIDEAHCISQWGASFRPDYSQINLFLKFLSSKGRNPFVLCLTATLSALARQDIVTEFNISPDNVVIEDIIRDNLVLHFEEVEAEEEKSSILRNFLQAHHPQKTIVYLYSQRKCEEYYEEFLDVYEADYYHAGVDQEEKRDVYDRFVNSEINLLFATTAFGMGINIPDIDCVAHLQIPNSVEEYYQQVGRGWRDKNINRKCNCILIWSETNFKKRKETIEGEKFTAEKLREAYKALTGGVKIKNVGQIVNKDKDAITNSTQNLQLVRYCLEKHKLIRTVGELNGSPETIEFHTPTKLWKRIVSAASVFDSFAYVSKVESITITEIMDHLFEQDILGNIKKLPAMKKDVFFEILMTELSDEQVELIVEELNSMVDFRLDRLEEFRQFVLHPDKNLRLKELLG